MSAYSLYDVLHTLVDRVGWPTEEEKRLCHESITEAEKMAIFGNLAQMMTCDHEAFTYGAPPDRWGNRVGITGNKCRKCGKIL